MRAFLWLLLGAAAVSSACGPDLSDHFRPSPLAGVNGAADSADHHCRIVLRSLSRRPNATGGFETNGSSWVWDGIVDVSEDAVAEHLIPMVLYQSGSERGWREVTTSAIDGAGPGFQRYFFRLQERLPGPGMSGTGLTRAVVRVIPFLRFAEGGRLFDHNRTADDFATYELAAHNRFSVGEDAGICPARILPRWGASELRFTAGGPIEQSTALVAGEELAVHYALERLPECRGTHNGHPAWSMLANVRFHPGGETHQGEVRAFDAPGGVPQNVARPVPFSVRIPESARSVEIWFHNLSGAGSSCNRWDSNDGQNYRFEVLQRVGWVGNGTVKVSREGGHPCSPASSGVMTSGFGYGTWARQRSIMGNVCFETWSDGVTDRNDADLWRRLDARVYYRFDPSEPFRWGYVSLFDRIGNNARYVWNIAALDPFRPYRCPEVPTSMGDSYEEARVEFFFAVNGVMYTQESGAPFVGVFSDYPNDPFRAQNCR